MGKEGEAVSMAAPEGEEAACKTNHTTTARADQYWYRRLLQALMWSLRRPATGYHRLMQRSGSSSTIRSSSSGRKSCSRVRVARLGNRRAFRLRTATARMRWRWLSPLSLLAKLRNAYINFMLSASSKLASTSEGFAFGPAFPSHPFLVPASYSSQKNALPPQLNVRAQHDKIVMDLYMSMAQHQFLCPASSY